MIGRQSKNMQFLPQLDTFIGGLCLIVKEKKNLRTCMKLELYSGKGRMRCN